MAEYQIDYTIKRIDGDDKETEIGFGTSNRWDTVDAALYAIGSDIDNRQWETEKGMPDPSDVDKERTDA